MLNVLGLIKFTIQYNTYYDRSKLQFSDSPSIIFTQPTLPSKEQLNPYQCDKNKFFLCHYIKLNFTTSRQVELVFVRTDKDGFGRTKQLANQKVLLNLCGVAKKCALSNLTELYEDDNNWLIRWYLAEI